MIDRVSRRKVLFAGAATIVPLTAAGSDGMPGGPTPADHPRAADPRLGYIFFTPAEAAFIEAACARLIPRDDLGPGAVEAAVPLFLDRQLAGDYGKGVHFYMQGPWPDAADTQGYQNKQPPAGYYRTAIAAIDAHVGKQGNGQTFAALPPDKQDDLLKAMEKGEVEIEGVNAKAFFKQLLQNVMEGFFSDPLYGGNRDMAGWKLIGFPGARYDYRPYVERHGEKLDLPPVSLLGGRRQS